MVKSAWRKSTHKRSIWMRWVRADSFKSSGVDFGRVPLSSLRRLSKSNIIRKGHKGPRNELVETEPRRLKLDGIKSRMLNTGDPAHATDHEPSFVYAPLDSATESIRLIRILPGRVDEQIRCEIRSATTGDRYFCLSYCWGPVDLRRIRLNGRIMCVRDNLLQFLHEVRRRRFTEWLWIDALCIDQDNLTERNHQVQQMTAIFQATARTVIWFGRRPASGGPSAPELAHFARRINSGDAIATSTLVWCRGSYFDRLWTLREFLTAVEPTIWWDGEEIYVRGFLRLVNHWYEHYVWTSLTRQTEETGPEKRRMDGLERIQQCNVFQRHLRERGEFPPLLKLITDLSGASCTDDRDRIYALLGLANDGAEFGIDYQEEVVALFLRLVRAYSVGPDRASFTRLARCLRLDENMISRHLLHPARPRQSVALGQLAFATVDLRDEGNTLYPTKMYDIWKIDHLPLSEDCDPSRRTFADLQFGGPVQRDLEICDHCKRNLSSNGHKQTLFRFRDTPLWLQTEYGTRMNENLMRIEAFQVSDATGVDIDSPPRFMRLALAKASKPDEVGWLFIQRASTSHWRYGHTVVVYLASQCGRRPCALADRTFCPAVISSLVSEERWTMSPAQDDLFADERYTHPWRSHD